VPRINRYAFFLLLLAVSSLPACIQIRSAQLQGLKNLLTEQEDPLKPYEWTLQWGDYTQNVYVVGMNPVYVFGNIYGDAVTIENMSLREAESLGKFNYLWQFIEKNGYTTAYESAELRATFECGGWKMKSRKPMVRLEQECKEAKGPIATNVIELDSDGNVLSITYALFSGYPPLVLTRNS